jgi:hypothetical protein
MGVEFAVCWAVSGLLVDAVDEVGGLEPPSNVDHKCGLLGILLDRHRAELVMNYPRSFYALSRRTYSPIDKAFGIAIGGITILILWGFIIWVPLMAILSLLGWYK